MEFACHEWTVEEPFFATGPPSAPLQIVLVPKPINHKATFCQIFNYMWHWHRTQCGIDTYFRRFENVNGTKVQRPENRPRTRKLHCF